MKPFFKNARVIAEGFDPNQYHKQIAGRGEPGFVMSRGELVEFMRCPSRWKAGHESDETKATEWGSMMDCLILEPSKFKDRFSICPETYPDSKTGEPKEWTFQAKFCKAWREEQEGKQIVKQDVRQMGDCAEKRLLSDDCARKFLFASKRQVYATAEYRQGKVVVPVKILLDLVPDKNHLEFGKSLGDFKTSASAEPRDWSWYVFKYGYHVQAAFYMDIYCEATGGDRQDFRHIVQESYPPYEVGKRVLSSEFVEMGRQFYQHALKKYAECIKSNYWPGYEEMTDHGWGGWSFTEPEAKMVQSIPDWNIPESASNPTLQSEDIAP